MISTHKAADAAKKENLDNLISTDLYKQYGAQDILPKQSVTQSVSPKSKSKKGDPPAKRSGDDRGHHAPAESSHNNYAYLQGPYGQPPRHQRPQPQSITIKFGRLVISTKEKVPEKPFGQGMGGIPKLDN